VSKAGQISDCSGGAATFLISYFFLAVLVRSVIGGELPSAISKEGLIWPDEVSAATKEAVEALHGQFEILEHDLNELTEREEAARRELLANLAASNAQRAVLRERFYAALRRLDRLAESGKR
jgi:hypothetical protein